MKNFSSLESPRARQMVGVMIFGNIIATFAIIARIWSRRIKRAGLAIDDWLAFNALFFFYIECACILVQIIIGGVGQHVQDVPPENTIAGLKAVFISQYFYPLILGSMRWSICALLLRIFKIAPFRKIVWGIIIFNLLYIIFNFIMLSVRCNPVSLNWNIFETGGHCVSQDSILITTVAWGLITEFMIWIAPMPIIWRLQMSAYKKIALSAVFALGLFDIIVGIVRIVTLLNIDFLDQSYSEAPAVDWIIVELSVAILVGCLPVCQPFLSKLVPDRLFTTLRSGKWTSNNKSTPKRRGYWRSEDDKLELVHQSGRNLSSVKGPLDSTKAVDASSQDASSIDEPITVRHPVDHEVLVEQGFSVRSSAKE